MRAIFLLLTVASLLFGAYTRDNTLETVYDDQTNLTWQDNAAAASQQLEWNASIDYCENLDFAGVQDWRLPNINELLSITDLGVVNPAIDTAFQNTALFTFYWSSTTFATDTAFAWVVNSGDGADTWRDKSIYRDVRCVRAGQLAPFAVPLSVEAKAVLALLFGLGAFAFMCRTTA